MMLDTNIDIDLINKRMVSWTASQRISWALKNLPKQHIVSTSFGAQAAVMLHLMTFHKPDILVVFIDTGYLFDETIEFSKHLTSTLNLNLKTFRPLLDKEKYEKKFGKVWENGLEGLELYNQNRKVEPMQRALNDLHAATWFSGIRKEQSPTREQKMFVELSNNRYKVSPILDWTSEDIDSYIKDNSLEYNPLWHKGYISIGDTHTTKSIYEVESIEQTRFFGLKRECGLHE